MSESIESDEANGGSERLLSIRDLHVDYLGVNGRVRAVDGVDVQIRTGEVVALVGESGSGKSTLAHSILNLLPKNAVRTGGTTVLNGLDLGSLGKKEWQRVRGGIVGLIPQDPMVSLNPVKRIGDQVAEALTIHGIARGKNARKQAVEMLAVAGIDRPELRAQQYPAELSGGMRQRVLIAAALVVRPKLLIADEPTSALDVTVQKQILDYIENLVRESGISLLLVTHDLAVATDRADRVLVMHSGRIVESGVPDRVLHDPQHSYTRHLVESAPSFSAPHLTASSSMSAGSPLLEVSGLSKRFSLPRNGTGTRTFDVVTEVTFDVKPAETVAIVGESGSGKSTIARLILRLETPTAGRVVFDGTDYTTLRGSALRALRNRIQLVYQSPFASLDPKFTVQDIIEEPLRNLGIGNRFSRKARAASLLEQVSLPTSYLLRRPKELSGGQRQRVAIARALAPEPELLVLDEPVSALDVSVQAQVLSLLRQIQVDTGISYLFISHDFAVVRQMAHRIAVVNRGALVEFGGSEEVFDSPRSSYTRDLLDALPGQRFSPAISLEPR